MGLTMSLENGTTNELYSLLPAEVCRELEKQQQTINVPRGASLIRHGVAPVGLIVLNSGTVQISVPCSRRTASVTTGEQGKVFGMRATIAGELPEIDVTCLEDCRVTIIPRDAFLDVLKTNPEMYFAVAKVLSSDLQIANRILRSSVRRGSAPRIRAPRPV
jgi:CRP-like cAMP-binding protein